MRIFRVGKEFDFSDSLWNFTLASALPQRGDSTIDEGRTNGALFHREKVVRVSFEISGFEARAGLHLEAGAVAVIPRRRRMNLNLDWQVKPGSAAKSLAQDFMLDLKLVLITGVLVMAATALREVWTRGLSPMRGRFDDAIGVGAGKAGFLLG